MTARVFSGCSRHAFGPTGGAGKECASQVPRRGNRSARGAAVTAAFCLLMHKEQTEGEAAASAAMTGRDGPMMSAHRGSCYRIADMLTKYE